MTASKLRYRPFTISSPISACLIAALTLLYAGSAWPGPTKDRFPISLADVQAKADAHFKKSDADGNGSLSPAEFESAESPTALSRMRERHDKKSHRSFHREHPHRMKQGNQGRWDRTIHEEIFDILDKNGDGLLSREEHAAGIQPQHRRLARKRVLFKRLDRDGDGTLSRQEMPDPAARLAKADRDGDGSISATEMRAHRKARHDEKDTSEKD